MEHAAGVAGADADAVAGVRADAAREDRDAVDLEARTRAYYYCCYCYR